MTEPVCVALATCERLPDLDVDDEPLIRALVERNVVVRIASWTGPEAPFTTADAVLIRSTWDYISQRPAFVAWARRVGSQTRLFNPAGVVDWNTDKHYLLELSAKGLPVVPSVLVGAADSLVAVMEKHGFWDCVLKPIVGAGSEDTTRFGRDDVDGVQEFLRQQPSAREFLLQPFQQGISHGETSLIFLDGRLSHATLRRPRDGDFRSQPEFGSTVIAVEPRADQYAVALSALNHVGEPVLYARVDLVDDDGGRPQLMEVELVEPSLYFAQCATAPGVLADALLRRVRMGSEP